MKVQLQQLKYFVAVAESRHFTQAAELTGVSQPSLSKQIHALERELGATLLTRTRGNVALTAAGEALLPRARRILADVETARLEIDELIGVRRGRLRLGATPSLCTSLVAPVLRRYQQSYPGVGLFVEEGGSQDLVQKLTWGSLDLVLIVLPEGGTDPALVAEPILRESTLEACRRAGFEPKFAIDGGEMDAVLGFVEAGLGVALVPSMVLAGRPALRATTLSPPGVKRTIALAHRRDVTPTHAARAWRHVLHAYLTEAAAWSRLPSGVETI